MTLSTGDLQFNLVRIEVPYESSRSAQDVIVDNIIVMGTDFIIPEFPQWLILPFAMSVATLVLFLGREKTRNFAQTRQSICMMRKIVKMWTPFPIQDEEIEFRR